MHKTLDLAQTPYVFYTLLPVWLSFRKLASVGRRHTLCQVLAFSGWLLSDFAMCMAFSVGIYSLSFSIVFQNCLNSIIFGSFIFNNPFPDSNLLISVSSLYLLLGVPKNEVSIL